MFTRNIKPSAECAITKASPLLQTWRILFCSLITLKQLLAQGVIRANLTL